MAKIDHLFVLMLENRSFDHMLAFSGLTGVAPPPHRFGFKTGAVDQLADDLPHEFDDVAAQIHGGAMDGFLGSGGPDTMLGFDETEVPVLIELAKNNLYFDNWFSSMPGPTWPNRLFAHAASSGGLDNSMGSLDAAEATTRSEHHLNFEHGHIFDRLTAKGVSWRIYHHHTVFNFDYPQVLCLKGMVDKRNDPNFFRPFRRFAADMSKGDVAGYTFIEPAYGLPAYSRGNSQHPTGTISLGEILVRNTYNAIFKQKVGVGANRAWRLLRSCDAACGGSSRRCAAQSRPRQAASQLRFQPLRGPRSGGADLALAAGGIGIDYFRQGRLFRSFIDRSRAEDDLFPRLRADTARQGLAGLEQSVAGDPAGNAGETSRDLPTQIPRAVAER